MNAVVVEILSGGRQSTEASTLLKSNPQKQCEPPTFVQHLLEKCRFAQHEIFPDGQESTYENMCKIWTKSLWGITLKNGVKLFPCFPYSRKILPPLTTRSNGH